MHCRECEFIGEPSIAVIDFTVHLLLCPECGEIVYDDYDESGIMSDMEELGDDDDDL